MHLVVTALSQVDSDTLRLLSPQAQVPLCQDRVVLVEISGSIAHLVARTVIASHQAVLHMGCEQDLPMVVAALLLPGTVHRSGTRSLCVLVPASPVKKN